MPPLLREHDDPTPSSTVVVEGRTAEEALEQVHREVGHDARILHADRVRRGGVGGFFARELVQLTVAADDDAPVRDVAQSEAPGSSAAPTDDGPTGETLADVLDRRLGPGQGDAGGVAEVVADLTAAADQEEESFGAALRAALRGGQDASPGTRGASPADGEHVDGRPHWALDAGSVGMSALAAGAEAVERSRPAETSEVDARPTPRAAVVRGDDARTLADVAPLDLDALASAVTESAQGDEPAGADEAVRATEPAPEPAAADVEVTAEPVGPDADAHPAVPAGPWSATRLLRAGVSEGLVAEVVTAAPADDLTWMAALVRAVEPLVRPRPYGECLYVGGRVERHVEQLEDATLCRLSDDDVPQRGSLALACRPSDNALDWMRDHARHHWLHLVVGGAGWRQWLWQEPAAVSWSSPEDLPVALGVAHMFDLPLVGTVDDGGPSSPNALDIAIAVRALLVQA